MRNQARNDKLDEAELKFDIEWSNGNLEISGWVANVKTHSYQDESEREKQVLLVFIGLQDGRWVKCQYEFQPYFFLECDKDYINEAVVYLENKYEKNLSQVEIVNRVDLEQINHLSGKVKEYLKLSFPTINDLTVVRNQLRSRIEKNKLEQKDNFAKQSQGKDPTKYFTDIREYDIPYHCRACIDTGLRCGKWFIFTLKDRIIMKMEEDRTLIAPPQLNYMSFDIETSKLPLKFPDSKIDQIMMISLQYESHAVLINNGSCVKQECVGFEYAPKEEYRVDVEIYNEESEQALLQRFFKIIVDYKPFIITSFNGDKFDWPFIEERAMQLGFILEDEIGIRKSDEVSEYFGRFICHMDCFNWVERDAFLPQGSHGLKAVTRSKLGYEPVEVDPEDMVPLAIRNSQKLAEYSISDAVATYNLYKKHIHDFIFALCTIIPLSPDEVLRKGSGTLCECLLMAMAYKNNIIFPNKKREELESFFQGHLLDSETYIGGKVDCLRSGVYRSDFAQDFRMDRECMDGLHRGVENLIKFMGRIEQKEFDQSEIDRCATEIKDKLEHLIHKGVEIKEKPLIYHLDVAAMYPNIILTNRLQPVAIVDNRTCSGCVFNSEENKCKRELEWQWKGDYYPLTRNEYETIKMNIEYEFMLKAQNDTYQPPIPQQKQTSRYIRGPQYQQSQPRQVRSFYELAIDQQQKIIKQRVKMYCQKTYKQVHLHTVQLRKHTVCMRENDFYVSTVRDFRDRRYEFKENVKIWKSRLDEYNKSGTVQQQREARDRIAFYDSQQLAHKIILNSFYGYVMRRGARWFSMEMAAMVTHIGSAIISTAKDLIDKVGLTLELDTDGIWCMLPAGFPEDFILRDVNGKNIKFNYPCFMLNELVYDKYKNEQYQWLKDKDNLEYGIKEEMSIFFEVDGPYKCMMIPAAREENKQLKKRYVVYHQNGSIAELKGFEIKRRGELKIIKIFQEEIFSAFVLGTNLKECYQECGKVADKWLNLLHKKGEGLDDKELIYYIGASKMLSKDLKDYGTTKGLAITAGNRMSEFLGAETVQGPGLNCTFIVSRLPINSSVTERAIPISIFETDDAVRGRFLRKWLKEPGMKDADLEMRYLIDWDYYLERFGNTVQKIVVIPALLQHEDNPIPSMQPPDWLKKRLREQNSGFQQTKISSFFQKTSSIAQQFAQIKHQPLPKVQQNPLKFNLMELEDIGKSQDNHHTPIKGSSKKDTTQQINRQSITPIKQYNAEVNRFNMDTQFPMWLTQQKKIWDVQIKNKKILQNSQMKIKENFKQVGNLKDHFEIQNQSLVGQVWQILQVYEIEPGLFSLWLMLENGQMINKQINVPRTLYVNSLQKEAKHQLVKRVLPREKKIQFLYEICMPEDIFQKDYGSFSDFLANPQIKGIYEYKMPLLFRFIAEIGSMCKLKSKVKLSQTKNISFEELSTVYELPNHQEYLQSKEYELINSYFCVQHINAGPRIGVWTLFSAKSNEYTFIITGKQKQVDQYRSVVKDALNRVSEENENLYEQEGSKIKIIALDDNKSACVYIDHLFSNIRTMNSMALVQQKLCVLQTPFSLKYLHSLGLKFACNDYPTLLLPPEEAIQFHPVGWQEKAIRQLILQYGKIPQTIQKLLKLSRYGSIPLCNVTSPQLGDKETHTSDGDYFNYLTDVLYSRVLKQIYNGISWYGVKVRDNRDLIPTDFSASYYEFPGLYMNFCVEIDILHLSVNTIALSDELKNMDKEVSYLMSKQGENEQEDITDQLSSAKTAFRVLRTLVLGWLEDIFNKGDSISDELLSNICRWVYGSSSPLYDEYLGKILKTLNKKVFHYFLVKLKSLGARVIFASMNKVIISTGKQTLEAAQSYTKYILEDMIQQPLFKYLALIPAKYYSSLIFKNKHNYLGYTEGSSNQGEPTLEYKLILNEFLPMRLQFVFKGMLVDFLDRAHQWRTLRLQETKEQTTAQAVLTISNLEQDLMVYLCEFIKNQLSLTLYKAMTILQEGYQFEKKRSLWLQTKAQLVKPKEPKKKQSKIIVEDTDIEQEEDFDEVPEESYEADSFVVDDDHIEYNLQQDEDDEQIIEKSQLEFQRSQVKKELMNLNLAEEDTQQNLTFEESWEAPKRLGLRTTIQTNSIAQMVIYLSDLISLEEATEQEMRRVKANCCRLLSMSEFSKEADYVDPCLTLIIPDMVCNGCYSVNDLDVFRNEWICFNCNNEYENDYIEIRLCEFLEHWHLFYQMQDLYCTRCKQVQEDPSAGRCTCSGSYILKLSQFPNELITNFKRFQENLLKLSLENNYQYLQELLKCIK